MTGTPESSLTRRNVLRGAAATAALAGPGSGLLAACATGGKDKDGAKQGAKDNKNPLGAPADKPLEIFIFNGGLTKEGDYAKTIFTPAYNSYFPASTVKQETTERMNDALQPRFVKGEPPDFVNNSGPAQMDMNALYQAGQLQDLTQLLDAQTVHDPNKKVKDILMPGTVELGSFDGKMHILYYAFTVYGLWYDKKLFAKHGWQPPKTWQQMIDLCGEIKKAGIAPWTYPGQNAPRYMIWPVIQMAAQHGGWDVILGIDNLEPNAWKNESIKLALEAVHSLRGKGFISDAAVGQHHLVAQTDWSQNKVAFVTSGSWIEGEQKDKYVPGFEVTFLKDPSLTGSDKLNASAIRAQPSEPYIVPKQAKNPFGGMEYMRHMLSKNPAKDFTSLVKSLTAVQNGAEGSTVSPGLGSLREALKAAGTNTYQYFWQERYRPLWNPQANGAMNEMMAGRATPDQTATRLQKAWDDVAKDDKVKKTKRSKPSGA